MLPPVRVTGNPASSPRGRVDDASVRPLPRCVHAALLVHHRPQAGRARHAPTLGSQELIYRRPLKVWSTFELELELAGDDDEWIDHIHRFVQDGELRALGITRALIWKRDVPTAMDELLRLVGATGPKPPPAWVSALFASDRDLLDATGRGTAAGEP